MSEAKLQVLGPYLAWNGAASLGRLALPGQESLPDKAGGRPVLVLVGPEVGGPDALQRARAAATAALQFRASGVLPLLAVERIDDRIAWAYEYVEGLGLHHAVGGEGNALLSARAAAEIVSIVAQSLLELGAEGLKNRGPEPTDVLVDSLGRVYVTGFAGPFPTPPSMRAPRGEDGEAAAVYRLGEIGRAHV